MKKLYVYVNDILIYVGIPKSQTQILKTFNGPGLKLFDDYTNSQEECYFDKNGSLCFMSVRRVYFKSFVDYGG